MSIHRLSVVLAAIALCVGIPAPAGAISRGATDHVGREAAARADLAWTRRSRSAERTVVGALPALPAAWPSDQFEIGLADAPGGAAALHAKAPFEFCYQYLAGGVNTGNGWVK